MLSDRASSICGKAQKVPGNGRPVSIKPYEACNGLYTGKLRLKHNSGRAGSAVRVQQNYFSKIFKDVVGVGYKEYTVLVRLKAAERLLRATNKSVREIATSCGFNDSNYFSTVFQNKYGVPPTQYKKDQFIQFLEK